MPVVRMGRRELDLEPWRDRIRDMLSEQYTHHEIVRKLRCEGAIISVPTLRRRLEYWGMTKPTLGKRLNEEQQAALRARIEANFWRYSALGDRKTVRMLRRDGFKLSLGVYQRLRRSMGLLRRIPPDQEEEMNQAIRDVLMVVLATGATYDGGYRAIANYLRRKNRFIGRYVQFISRKDV